MIREMGFGVGVFIGRAATQRDNMVTYYNTGWKVFGGHLADVKGHRSSIKVAWRAVKS